MCELDSLKKFLFLSSVKIEAVNEAKKLYGSRIAPDFNIFDYLRDDEMGLSWCLATLLDPNGKHGQGSLLLQQFLLIVDSTLASRLEGTKDFINNNLVAEKKEKWAEANFDNCQMQVEHSTLESRRIDIHLQFCDGEIIGIENKPWAGDQVNQLKDYASYIQTQALGRPWLLIYLCNSEPSEESISSIERKALEADGNFLCLAFNDVLNWLQSCINLVKAPVVRTFIEELAKFIRKEINREVDMEVRTQLMEVIEDDLGVAMQVANSIVDVKRKLLAKLKLDLTEASRLRGYKLSWKPSLDSQWKAYTGFGFNFSENQSDEFEVWFEFTAANLNGFYWGIRRKNESISNLSSAYKELNSLMTNRYGGNKPTLWWPWWIHYKPNANYKSWEKSPEPWIAIKDGSLVQDILLLMSELQQYLKENNAERYFQGSSFS